MDVRPVDDFATEQRVELYVSDYSTNAGFYHRDGSSEAWTGPLGKRSMYLTLWGRAAHQAKTDIEDRRFKPGVLLTLQNVRVKAVTNARVEHDGAMLEAVLHDKTQGTHEKTGERFWYALGGKASKGVQAAFFEPYTKEWFAAEALIRSVRVSSQGRWLTPPQPAQVVLGERPPQTHCRRRRRGRGNTASSGDGEQGGNKRCVMLRLTLVIDKLTPESQRRRLLCTRALTWPRRRRSARSSPHLSLHTSDVMSRLASSTTSRQRSTSGCTRPVHSAAKSESARRLTRCHY